MMNYKISFFRSVSDNEPYSISLDELSKRIKSPSASDLRRIIKLRETDPSDKKKVRAIKVGLPAVSVSCLCQGGHEEAHILAPTKLMQVDFDQIIYTPAGNATDFEALLTQLKADEYTLMCFVSPSAKGIKLIVNYEGDHLQAFEGLKAYYQNLFGLEMDKTCKDLNRLMFLSYDPNVYANFNAKRYVAPSEPLEAPKPKFKPSAPSGYKWAQQGSVGDDVEKVIDQICAQHIDITGNYDTWRRLGYGIASEFGERGRSYFHAISYYHPEYDYETCDTQYSAFLKHDKPRGGGSTIKSLFGIAKDHGIDIRPAHLPQKGAKSGGGRGKTLDELKGAKIDLLNGFDVDVLEGSILEETEIQTQAPQVVVSTPEVVATIDTPEVIEELPEGSLESLLQPIPDTKDSVSDFQLNGFYFYEGKMFTYNVKSGKYNEKEISNFTMEYLYHFDDGSKNTKRLVKIQRNTGEITIFEMTDEEAKLDKFKTIIRSKAASFRGTANEYELIFTALTNREKKAKAILSVGYNAEFDLYAFSDALFYKNAIHKVNDVGIIFIDNTTFYLPAYSKFNLDNPQYITERRTRYLHGVLDFEQWSSLIYTAFKVNGAIALCFVIQCLFRDIIFKKLNFFPFMFLFGPPGAGKSSFIDMVLRLWGDKDPGVSVKSNFKAIARSASQRKNALLFLKEYDNNISPDLENAFKNFYDGQGYSVAQTSNDNKTQTWLVESGIMIDGNTLPTKSPALFDRNIILHFEETRFSAESTEAHKQLTEASEAGFGSILIEILKHRDTYKDRIKEAFDFTYNELKGYEASFDGVTVPAGDFYYKDVNISKMPERTIRHLAFIISGYTALKNVLKFPFSGEDIFDKLLTEAIDKVDMLGEINDISMFWDALNYTHSVDSSKVYEGKHWAKDAVSQILFIRLKELYPVYVEYCKKINAIATDFNTLKRSLINENYAPFIAGKQKGRKDSINKIGFGSCYQFKWEEAVKGHRTVGGKEIKFVDRRVEQQEQPF